MKEVRITVTKEIIDHEPRKDRPLVYPSRSMRFQGQPLTHEDQRQLISTLVDDLVRKIEDFKEKESK